MKVTLNELTPEQVSGVNQRVVLDAHRRDPASKQQHVLTRPTDLAGCLAGIFYQSATGYAHLPLEKMAGLILYRIAEGQFFLDGNKRTAMLSCAIFLQNHGLKLRLDRAVVNDLIWGFAKGEDGSPAKYGADDAIEFVFDNVLPRA